MTWEKGYKRAVARPCRSGEPSRLRSLPEVLESRLLLTGIAMNSSVASLPLGTSAGGGGYTGVVSADFNGDGKADLAVLESTYNQASNQIGILFGNGSGGFSLSANYSTSVNTAYNDIAAGDFNGDGKIDVAVALYAGGIGIYYNQGAGTFGSRTDYPLSLTNARIAAADFNLDGITDVAVAGGTTPGVSLLLSQTTGGVRYIVTGAGGELRTGDVTSSMQNAYLHVGTFLLQEHCRA